MRMRALLLAAVAVLATLVPVLVTAGPADATRLRTWNRLAMCESSGRWHVNTHNGYYGGLQISPSTWRSFGGHRFARLPHQATRRQQIHVAERIQNHQGWRAWPSCSSRIGLR